jgi:hypothetical protein
MHWTHCKDLHVVFVGPEIPTNVKFAGRTDPIHDFVTCCSQCEKGGRSRRLSLFNGLWHEASHLNPPSSCIALNSGVSDSVLYSTWADAVKASIIPKIIGTFANKFFKLDCSLSTFKSHVFN